MTFKEKRGVKSDLLLAFSRDDKMITKEQGKEIIKKLLEKRNIVVETGVFKKFSEQDTKAGFIEPLFEALGWDVRNIDEVAREEKISKGRVDYSFRINGIPKFFLEAKKLKEDLDNPKFVQQAINYAFHKGCTWAVLTDFECVKILNAQWKTPNLLQSHLKTIQCNEFMDRFSELWLLSKESFEQGLLDKEAEKWGKKAKKIPIDKQLLADFTRFREMLSKSINKINQSKKLKDEDIDESVQRILDRLIFIKTCEDRELEEKRLISNLREWESKETGRLILKLREIFEYFDKNYNSKIFASHLCDELEIENAVLSEIIKGLYEKDESLSYDFSAIEADVLGNIYEQYLGHLLKKTEKRAKLSENHQHRKEQGIYYTPTYIVDYIVRNTLGILLKDKKMDPRKIRVLDPACGSGSFLIKAFDVLNEYYEMNDKFYSQTRMDFKTGNGYTAKVNILENNIFGVDLDKQAVEIAQLNLLLKIAEKGRLLPELQQNIKCGNSLIENPLIAGDKAFNWGEEFKEIMQEGGFDVVIGNPPWSSKIPSEFNRFLAKKYQLSGKNVNICALFILEGLTKLKPNGYFGFLLPKVVVKNEAYYLIRKQILEGYGIKQLFDFGQFPGVASDAIALIVQKKKGRQATKISFYEGENLIRVNSVNQQLFKNNYPFVFSLSLNENIEAILNKIKNRSTEIGKILKIKRGIELGQKSYITKCSNCGNFNEANVKYYGSDIKKCKKCGKKLIITEENTLQISSIKKQKDYTLECIAGSQLKRYNISDAYYIRKNLKGIDYKEEAFNAPKILIKRISTKIEGTYSGENLFAFNTVYSLYGKDIKKDMFLFVLALLNSKLIHFFYEHSYNVGMNLTTQVTIDYLSKIPIRIIAGKYQKQIIRLVDKMIAFNRRLYELEGKKTDARAKIEAEIKNTDAEIDELVYKIYGITDKEKKIIEDSLN